MYTKILHLDVNTISYQVGNETKEDEYAEEGQENNLLAMRVVYPISHHHTCIQ